MFANTKAHIMYSRHKNHQGERLPVTEYFRRNAGLRQGVERNRTWVFMQGSNRTPFPFFFWLVVFCSAAVAIALLFVSVPGAIAVLVCSGLWLTLTLRSRTGAAMNGGNTRPGTVPANSSILTNRLASLSEQSPLTCAAPLPTLTRPAVK